MLIEFDNSQVFRFGVVDFNIFAPFTFHINIININFLKVYIKYISKQRTALIYARRFGRGFVQIQK